MAEGKGVHREVESKGSLRQSAGLTNRNCKGGSHTWMRRRKDSKSSTCTQGVAVYAAGIRGKGGAHYPGRSAGEVRGRDWVEIVWHPRESRRRTDKTKVDLSACRTATRIERCG